MAVFRIASQQEPVLNLSMTAFLNRDASTAKAVALSQMQLFNGLFFVLFFHLKILYTAKAFLNFPLKTANVYLFRTLTACVYHCFKS